MSKLNKIITNQPVVLTEEEVNNLSETLSAVRTAGGEGGHLYTGDNKYIGVDNGNYKIRFLDNAAEKLESISSKLDKTEAANTYLTSANAQTLYQTKEAMSAYATTAYVSGVTASIYYTNILGLVDALSAKQDTLTFGYDENDAISSINSHKLAGTGGVTGDYYSASNPSGFINSTQAETQILEKHYLTEASGNSLYVPKPEGLSEGQYYAMTTSSWKVIQGAGDVSGISTVAHDDTLTGNGNTVKLGVDTTVIQTKLTDVEIQNITDVTTLKTASSTWDNVSAKLNTTDFNTYTATTAPSTYQPLGNYLSSNALAGYATTALLDTISSKIERDIPTTVSQLTDSGNYYQKTETSGKTEITNALNTKLDSTAAAQTYQTKGDYVSASQINDMATQTWVSNQGYLTNASLTNYYTKSETSGAIELSTEFGKYALKSEIPTVPTKVSDLTDSANYYKTNETSSKNELSTEFAKYLTNTQYNTDSATFALKTDLNDLVSSAGITTTETDYVMTTSGWKVLTLPGGGMTQVIHDETLTGQGNDSNSKLGVVWSALSGNTINSALSAGSATTANKAASAFASKRLQSSAAGPVIVAEDVTALQDWASSNSSTWDEVSAKLGTAQYALDSATFVTSSNTSISADGEQYALTTTGWAKVQGGSTFTGVTTTGSISGGGVNNDTIGLLTSAENALTAVANKVDKPDTTQTVLNNNYLIYSTLTDPTATTGWMPLSANYYSKSESLGTFVATANIDTTTLSGDGKSVSTKLGVKTDVIATRDYVNSSFLPLSGGTVSGTTIISGNDFNTLEVKRSGQTSTGIIGINGAGGMSVKIADSNSNNTQLNIDPTATMDKRFSIGDNPYSPAAYLIPAVTANTTAGLTNDGILHIILES